MDRKLKAIIFDVDGTLADTEQFGHLPACNEAIYQLGLDIHWTWPQFITMIHTIPGSAKRFSLELANSGYPPNEVDILTKQFSILKQELYIKKYLPLLSLRPGIVQLLDEAVEKNIMLGIVSASHESQIKALLKNQLVAYRQNFKVVLGKESGKKIDSNGLLFTQCVQQLQVNTHEALVIEDSEAGLEAALCAHIPTAVFYNDYTFGNAFKGAKLVAPSLEMFSVDSLEKICLN